MNILLTQKIEKPARDVWHILAHDFDKNYVWMSSVFHTDLRTEGETAKGAPLNGRVCNLSTEEGGLAADEKITFFDDENMVIEFHVVIKNKKLPVISNDVKVKVVSLSENSCEVVWEAEPTLRTIGKILSPLLKLGLNKAFKEILEELKYFAETGNPHPRKVKAMEKVKK